MLVGENPLFYILSRFFLSKPLTSGPWLRCRWIGGVEADLSMSFWLLTGGRGLHTVYKCIVFYRVSMFSRYSEPVLGNSVLF